MSVSDGDEKIDVMLRHLGSGHDLQDFPGTTAEKLGFVRTAGARGLVAWSKARGRYELTSVGWRRVMPRRGFGLASLGVSATIGAAIGTGALAALWLPADASRPSVGRHVRAAVSHPGNANSGLHTPLQTPSTPPVTPEVQPDPVPSGQRGSPIEPVKVAEQRVEEPRAEATPTANKHATVKKSRHNASRARTRRTWARANPYRDDRYASFGRMFR
jgi:hypothetical protein